MTYVLIFMLGVAIGAAIVLVVHHLNRRGSQQQLQQTFSSLAGEALDANSRRLIEVLEGSGKRFTEAAASQLEGKKALIDQSLTVVGERLETVRTYLQSLEAQRRQDFGQLSTSVASLSQTAGELHKMLASTQRRGAWGERMAEDVLRLAGLQENLNYLKQSTADAASGRADFTFLLPNNIKCNMDVKFPLESYKAYLDADAPAAGAAALTQLCAAVRGHVKAVAARGYIDPRVPTVPYVIVFIPSEQISAAVLQCQPDLIDEALAIKVVLASPLTLYAMVSVMRQAAESFNLMQTADEVISLLGQFSKQWQNYNIELDKLGDRITQAAKQFETVRTTRSNMLQRPLDRIEELRTSRGLIESDK